ncbi:hypothetical protein U0070_021913, partial [Myodes glareolus]
SSQHSLLADLSLLPINDDPPDSAELFHRRGGCPQYLCQCPHGVLLPTCPKASISTEKIGLWRKQITSSKDWPRRSTRVEKVKLIMKMGNYLPCAYWQGCSRHRDGLRRFPAAQSQTNRKIEVFTLRSGCRRILEGEAFDPGQQSWRTCKGGMMKSYHPPAELRNKFCEAKSTEAGTTSQFAQNYQNKTCIEQNLFSTAALLFFGDMLSSDHHLYPDIAKDRPRDEKNFWNSNSEESTQGLTIIRDPPALASKVGIRDKSRDSDRDKSGDSDCDKSGDNRSTLYIKRESEEQFRKLMNR